MGARRARDIRRECERSHASRAARTSPSRMSRTLTNGTRYAPKRRHPRAMRAVADPREGPLQEKEVRQMIDRDKNSGSSKENQGGMSGSSGRSGSQGDQQSTSSGRPGQSGSSSQGGIRDNASPG